MKTNVQYWLKGEKVQNFGDYVAEFLSQELFIPYRVGVRGVFLVGSVIDDLFTHSVDEDIRPVVFWTCGMRGAGGLSIDAQKHVEIKAVRGPITASNLLAGSLLPIGDSAFLLPALYSPKIVDAFCGKSICMPHFHETRTDDELLMHSLCDKIVRPNIDNRMLSFLDVVDAIFSASFVLSSSLHGCIVAAAYGKPFAFFRADEIDLPLKWKDFAASINIDVGFSSNLEEGNRSYLQDIAPNIVIPNLIDALLQAPFPVRQSGFLKVTEWYLEREGSREHSQKLLGGAKMEAFSQSQSSYYAQLINEADYFYEQNLAARSELEQRFKAREADSASHRATVESLKSEVQMISERAEKAERHSSLSETKSRKIEERNLELADRLCSDAAAGQLERDRLLSESERLNLERAAVQRKLDEARVSLDLSRQENADKQLMLNDCRVHQATLEGLVESLCNEAKKQENRLSVLAQDHEKRTDELTLLLRSRELEVKSLREEQIKLSALNEFLQYQARMGDSVDRLSRDFEKQEEYHVAVADRLSDLTRDHKQRIDELTTLFNSREREMSSLHQKQGDYYATVLKDQGQRIDKLTELLKEIDPKLSDILDNQVVERERVQSELVSANVQIRDKIAMIDIIENEKKALELKLDNEVYLISQELLQVRGISSEKENQIAKMEKNRTIVWGYFNFLAASIKRHPWHIRSILRPAERRAAAIVADGLFDGYWYLLKYPEVAISGLSPDEHFIRIGYRTQRSPTPFLDLDWYANRYPELTASGQNLVSHYFEEGEARGFWPNSNFDPGWYLRQYPDVRESGVSPLAHYLRTGENEGRWPSSNSDPSKFVGGAGDERSPAELPLAGGRAKIALVDDGPVAGGLEQAVPTLKEHDAEGERESVANGAMVQELAPFVDEKWYFKTNPDVALAGVSALQHYTQFGEAEGRAPNPSFDPQRYLVEHPEVASSGLSPLLHFARNGDPAEALAKTFSEESGHVVGLDETASITVEQELASFVDEQWYSTVYPDVASAEMSSLQHYIRFGEAEGRSPNPTFDPQWYLDQYPEVATAGLPPLLHYARFGQHDNRLTRAYLSNVPVLENETRILIIDSQYPTPNRDSGSIDAVNFIKIFIQLGFRVYFIATTDFKALELNHISRIARDELMELGATIVDDTYGHSIEDVVRLNGGYFDAFFLSRVHAGGVYYEVIRTHTVQPRVVFNTVDLHSLREMREGLLNNSQLMINEAQRTAAREFFLSAMATATVVVSAEELRILKEEVPAAQVFEVPLIREIPGRGSDFSMRQGIGFIGGYRHPPNIDAAEFFLNEIWPLVRARMPDLRFYLMGSDMPDRLSTRNDPGLIIIGHVDVLADAFNKLRLTVAPLRYGAGAKGKVVSSLSHGVPCVASPIAAEGMGLSEEKGVLTALTPQQYVDQIALAYENEELWLKLSKGGIAAMNAKYAYAVGVSNVSKILSKIGLTSSNAGLVG